MIFITHPEVAVVAETPITKWKLSNRGRERAEAFATNSFLSDLTAIWASTERKALETAEILARPRRIPVMTDPCLGENDRSGTGFLPPAEFEACADRFFSSPIESHRGWERAADAQSRIVDAVTDIVAGHPGGDLAIVSHGAVGTLLWCHLAGRSIDRRHDQPSQGHFWIADLDNLRPRSAWQALN